VGSLSQGGDDSGRLLVITTFRREQQRIMSTERSLPPALTAEPLARPASVSSRTDEKGLLA
jgi:hypothetical protein